MLAAHCMEKMMLVRAAHVVARTGMVLRSAGPEPMQTLRASDLLANAT
jgi:hypothetical protein